MICVCIGGSLKQYAEMLSTPKTHETYYSIIGTEGKSMDLFEIGRSVSV